MAINKQISAKSDQAARLRAAREAAGFKSASDAAQKFRWRASTYMAHENGQNGIRAPEPALTYARVYGVDLTWLLTGLEPGGPQAAQRGKRQRSSRASQGLRE